MPSAMQKAAMAYAQQGFYVIRLYHRATFVTREKLPVVLGRLYVAKHLLPQFIRESIVVSLPNNKRVYDVLGLYRGTRSAKKAGRMFAKDDCNIGIRTGRASGIVVVDIDDHALVKPFLKQYKVPATRSVHTAKGVHFYFRYPEGVKIRSSVKRIPGLDIIAENAYVVAPPSHYIGNKGTYCWDDENKPIADVPPELLNDMLKVGKRWRDQSHPYILFCNIIVSTLLKYIFRS